MAAPFAPSPFSFGYYYDEKKDAADKTRELCYRGERAILLFGVNGSGKSTRMLAKNLATIKDRSLVVLDIKGGADGADPAHSPANLRRGELQDRQSL